MEQAIFKADIIGAGPQVMTAANKLSKQNASNPVTITTAGLSVQ
jgi:thioredoxin reductase